jgi:hypothetical protein
LGLPKIAEANGTASKGWLNFLINGAAVVGLNTALESATAYGDEGRGVAAIVFGKPIGVTDDLTFIGNQAARSDNGSL